MTLNSIPNPNGVIKDVNVLNNEMFNDSYCEQMDELLNTKEIHNFMNFNLR